MKNAQDMAPAAVYEDVRKPGLLRELERGLSTS